MRFEASGVIERPVATVFRFVADEHVRNHPRWDPDIGLEQVTDGPIGLGTIMRRRNSRYGTPVEGTMEVVEFEREQAFGTIIHDGSIEMRGRATFETVGPNRTKVTICADSPALDEAKDTGLMTSRMERTIQNMKQLIETET